MENSEENPYAPPSSDVTTEKDPLDVIKARVAPPAVALITMASIQSVFIAISFISHIIITALGSERLLSLVCDFCLLVFSILIAIGGAKLRMLESYRMARLGAWIACVPLITPFIFVGIPFGIWSLRLLAKPEIQAAFPDAPAKSRDD